MKTALFIDSEHKLDCTVLLVALEDLAILQRAVSELAEAEPAHRRVRFLLHQLNEAVAGARRAAVEDGAQ